MSLLLLTMILCTLLPPTHLQQSCLPTPTTCPVSDTHALLPANHTQPYLYIAGIFGVHSTVTSSNSCGEVRERGFQNLEAFLWAVKSFKDRNPGRLTGISVGALGLDSCSSAGKAVQQVLNLESCQLGFGSPFIEPSNILAFIGPDTSSQAQLVAPLLGNLQKTVVSHAATSTALNSIDYLLRTVPSDEQQIQAIVTMLKQQNIKYIQVLYSGDTYGRSAWQEYDGLVNQHGICTVHYKEIPSGYSNADMDTIMRDVGKHPQTKMVVLLTTDTVARDVLLSSKRVFATNQFTWIGTNSWGRNPAVISGVEDMAVGSVTMSLDAPVTPALSSFTAYMSGLQGNTSNHGNPWVSEYKQGPVFSLDVYVPYTLQAVDAVLIGIDNAVKQACSQQSRSFCSGFLSSKWPMIYDNIRKVEISGAVKFDQVTGNQLLGKQGINRITNGYQYTSIGSFSGGNLLLNNDLKVTSVCGVYPCTVCGEVRSTAETTTSTTPPTTTTTQPASQLPQAPPLKLREGDWVIALLILAAIGVFLVIAFEIYLSYKMSGKNFISSMWLGQTLLLALFLSFLCLFAFVPAPTHATCGIIRFCVGTCYTMIFSVFLVKLMIIFSSKTVGYLKGIFQVLMFVFAWGVQIAIDVEWLIMRPPEALPLVDNTTGETTNWVCSQTFTHHVTTLSYVMFLILICTLLSFKAHGIVTNHRESVYIGICSFLSILVWIAWILLGMLNSNKEFEDPCLAFGLFIVALIVLLTMYLPKVKQLNTMDKDSLYIDDDTPDYTTPSIIPPSIQAGSLVLSNGLQKADFPHVYDNINPIYKTQPITEPVVFVDDIHGDVYSAPMETKTHRLHVDANPDALYLKHPGLSTLPRTLPVVRTHSLRSASHSQRSAPVTTRVLRKTVDLSGRSPPDGSRAYSEVNAPVSRGLAYSEVNAPVRHPVAYSEVNAPVRHPVAYSEVDGQVLRIPRGYGTARSVISARSVRSGGTLTRSRSLHDVGAL